MKRYKTSRLNRKASIPRQHFSWQPSQNNIELFPFFYMFNFSKNLKEKKKIQKKQQQNNEKKNEIFFIFRKHIKKNIHKINIVTVDTVFRAQNSHIKMFTCNFWFICIQCTRQSDFVI